MTPIATGIIHSVIISVWSTSESFEDELPPAEEIVSAVVTEVGAEVGLKVAV